jgi:squalene-hopene/tetraprenyl-beta-curcumene cyclase
MGRTVPILTMSALCGRLGEGAEAWRRVMPLPFELAAFPQSWFAALRLPVVSYALPALIAIGQARHRHAPSRNPLARAVRHAVAARTLEVLERIQPTNGGFLEATPLTSFVTMSLAGSGLVDHPVTRKGVEFLVASVRADGSWPIDTNLATWVTTLSVNALANDPSFQLPPDERAAIREWLLGQQYRTVHPYTNAAPGGWAWTDLPGGVPDADDTAGALLALKNLGDVDDRVREAAALGVKWLLDLQNRDGGIPTFCRGWTNLPFDQSGNDLTAHTIRAWCAWLNDLPADLLPRLYRALLMAGVHLSERTGIPAWRPLWFGNQHWPGEGNPLYGMAKVSLAISGLLNGADRVVQQLPSLFRKEKVIPVWREACKMQHKDGAFGGPNDAHGSVEETALALEAMAAWKEIDSTRLPAEEVRELDKRIALSADWLITRVESGIWTQPAPIGFYFARLWYYERLYPMIFTVGALGKVAALLERGPDR